MGQPDHPERVKIAERVSEDTMDRMAWLTGHGLVERMRGKTVRLFLDGAFHEIACDDDGKVTVVSGKKTA